MFLLEIKAGRQVLRYKGAKQERGPENGCVSPLMTGMNDFDCSIHGTGVPDYLPFPLLEDALGTMLK